MQQLTKLPYEIEFNQKIYQFISTYRCGSVDAILFDLGMSSMQIDSDRGFSFRSEYDGELGKFCLHFVVFLKEIKNFTFRYENVTKY